MGVGGMGDKFYLSLSLSQFLEGTQSCLSHPGDGCVCFELRARRQAGSPLQASTSPRSLEAWAENSFLETSNNWWDQQGTPSAELKLPAYLRFAPSPLSLPPRESWWGEGL